MRLKRLFKNKRGIVGIEAAIVLIAFIIIAAALSYVVINMGFFITQKTKETIDTGLEESMTSLQLDGTVTGKTNTTSAQVLYLLTPVKLAAGKADVDLNQSSVVVSVYMPNATLVNIYQGVVSTSTVTWDNLITALALNDNQAKFAIYNGNGNTVLENREKAFLVVRLQNSTITGMLSSYDTVKIEVRSPTGAALTIVRTVPSGLIANSFVDLG
jgi:flagellin FlaB